MGIFRRSRTPRGVSWNVNYLSNILNTNNAIDVIIAEHALREQVQREEASDIRTAACEKLMATEDQKTQSENVKSTLEQALYRAVSMLEPPIKLVYDALRREPNWFMRGPLIEYCIDSGGCCSRQCGCCAKRCFLGAHKGQGHCTSECWCCAEYRGCELSSQQKKDIRESMEARLRYRGNCEHSPYLLRMASGFFGPLKPPKHKKTWWF
ncbi:unnamed protein product [Penicillium salamii]|uniref:Uncharacterized protein n=1 Tax=Penicillium salamii TaxID=1612424 RepID=A0A9W4NXE0_9EURO|nr:unnamed protein product [Penicillium salamii]CAG8152653.1 unnamed protein product [Penicillium salamii]CAG8241576.1 unnamed protein product [Penicillium salamii]CAG8267694.1 unnamed protein product [Penicillium salamii]CAG8317560.1 unnamed protein product [Penicillium salamii]